MSSRATLASRSGLAFDVIDDGTVERIRHDDVLVNALPGNALDGAPANLYLRRLGGPRPAWTPLLGPRAPGRGRLEDRGMTVAGAWESLRYSVALVLADDAPAWFWHVEIENAGNDPVRLDLVKAQDLALADYWLVRMNEYYVSQYVDHTPLAHPRHGWVLAARQNLPVGGRHPWAIAGSLRRASSFCTDALQFYGIESRFRTGPAALDAPALAGSRLQHEHAMAVLQDEPLQLAPGETAHAGFFLGLVADHPAPSSTADLAFVDGVLALAEATPPDALATRSARTREGAPSASLFSEGPCLESVALDETDLDSAFGTERRSAERDARSGALHSFFTGASTHVVLAAKERASLRAHAQILRTGTALVPEEPSLTTTVWMNGVFHSMLTEGHVSINRLLSGTHGYLGQFRSHGQRVFVEIDGHWRLLDQPSAFAMTPNGARWLYKHARGLIEVESRAPAERHELWLEVRITEGDPCRLLVANHLALYGDDGSRPAVPAWSRDEHGVFVRALPGTDVGERFPQGGYRIDFAPAHAVEAVGGDERLFRDGQSRGTPFLAIVVAPTRSFALRITGALLEPSPEKAAASSGANDEVAARRFWRAMTGDLSLLPPAADDAGRALAGFGEILPWFAHDALVHYLAPRGLEQYTGGGWGTRDVCQGPVELLLALGRFAPVRELLALVFANQNPDGDWPQWFTFFARERRLRGPDAHGDIVFWPLFALGEYLFASGDAAFLDAEVPFFHAEAERAERASLLTHVERALALIARRAIPGTALTEYGHGDWNDSLQPVDMEVARRLCSAWTVTLHCQMLGALAPALRAAGRTAFADDLDRTHAAVRADFHRHLVVDGVVAGYALFADDGRVAPWLHPRDADAMGVHYSVLAMIHGVLAGLFTPEQAAHHVGIIERHLSGADGVRLFDRPIPYRGGLQRRFRRGESSPFFGREIGLMYTHAHLRYAEAMAQLGRGDALFRALRQAIPVGLADVVPGARPRQSNCYTSSSDATFPDRYAAEERYDEVKTGAAGFEGGWRVYSSGPGIALRLVRERLLGVRLMHDAIGIDPVLPRTLDGLAIDTRIDGRGVRVRYRVGPQGFGARAVALNGTSLAFTRTANPYREGGVAVALDALRAAMRESDNELVVELG
jgi:cellobiose phosphorylase